VRVGPASDHADDGRRRFGHEFGRRLEQRHCHHGADRGDVGHHRDLERVSVDDDSRTDRRLDPVTVDARRRVADAFMLVGGAALLASAFTHWVSSGYGSGLRGHALIDALISVGRHFPGLSAARLTILWYLVPALGAASWIATGMRGAGSRAARIVAVSSVVATAASFGAFGWLVGYGHLGIGAWLAVFGAAALVTGSWVIAPRDAKQPATGRG
jgi:hypothetical protein